MKNATTLRSFANSQFPKKEKESEPVNSLNTKFLFLGLCSVLGGWSDGESDQVPDWTVVLDQSAFRIVSRESLLPQHPLLKRTTAPYTPNAILFISWRNSNSRFPFAICCTLQVILRQKKKKIRCSKLRRSFLDVVFDVTSNLLRLVFVSGRYQTKNWRTETHVHGGKSF